jgi:hypothetical protein
MPINRPSGSFSALLPLAAALVLGACDADGRAGTAASKTPTKAAPESVVIPPLPEKFDSTGCYFHGATYRPHPDLVGDDQPLTYLLRTERLDNKGSFYEAGLVFEARDRRSGALVTTLTMVHTTSMGISLHGAHTENGALRAEVLHLNRDLGVAADGDVPELELPAPYALEFANLHRELYYRHGRWEDLGDAVTYDTPAKVKPDFRNRWVLQSCGAR